MAGEATTEITKTEDEWCIEVTTPDDDYEHARGCIDNHGATFVRNNEEEEITTGIAAGDTTCSNEGTCE